MTSHHYTNSDTDFLEIEDVSIETEKMYHLIIWNDDVNTFDWVIQALMEICNHTYEQAEQCSLLIHFKGKYAVKEGSYEELEPMCTAITDRGISATIETTVP
jgi:ATP-dependent Clp protease adaptor protein ClpS